MYTELANNADSILFFDSSFERTNFQVSISVWSGLDDTRVSTYLVVLLLHPQHQAFIYHFVSTPGYKPETSKFHVLKEHTD